MSTAKKLPNETFGNLNEFDDVELSPATYEKFAAHMYEIAGVNLPFSPKNHALIRNRIIKILRRHGLSNYEDYWKMLKQGDDKVQNEFVSALTTNMTSFYRESSHFDFLKSVLPEFSAKNSEVRIWCAAASTGQEPYTLAMTVCDALSEAQVAKTRILATDIDLTVLKKASMGVYEEREAQGLELSQKTKYFEKIKRDGDEVIRAKDQIHKLIRFAPFNLMNEKYVFQNKFHVIFCRNVLIYFDEATTKKVIENLTSCLAPGGYLVLGHSESGNVKHPQLKPLSRAVYVKI
jgi:chemotaxis protein methyltransferase CheR